MPGYVLCLLLNNRIDKDYVVLYAMEYYLAVKMTSGNLQTSDYSRKNHPE